MKVLAWYAKPNDIENRDILKYTYPIALKKICKNLIEVCGCHLVVFHDHTPPFDWCAVR